MSIMDSQNRSKINSLLMRWPKGTIATYDWLSTQDVYRQLADIYVNSGWIERVGRGAFKRSGDEVNWMGAVYAMQTQLNLTIHPAGKTALQMQGYAHYLPVGRVVSNLFGCAGEKLPAWFKSFSSNMRYTMTNLFGEDKSLGLTDFKAGEYSIKLSTPERAMLEVCYDVPDKESFEEAEQLMEGLTTLRPDLVQELLEQCNSVKTKRLFMYFAEEQNHAWIKRLNLSKVDFGSGKRSFFEGGEYNQKYKIVVPKRDLAA